VAGLVVLAPHVFVEPVTTANIQQARRAYLHTDLRQKLARHHDDPDSAFWGWNDIWLHPDFPRWNIEAELDAITCPVLALQGVDDEYGTLEQIERIARRVPGTQTQALPQCGHSPHRDQPDAVLHAVRRFMGQHAPSLSPAAAGPLCPHPRHPQGDTTP
jgi:pimeloyl-ACP methyl ester carboxylesterase